MSKATEQLKEQLKSSTQERKDPERPIVNWNYAYDLRGVGEFIVDRWQKKAGQLYYMEDSMTWVVWNERLKRWCHDSHKDSNGHLTRIFLSTIQLLENHVFTLPPREGKKEDDPFNALRGLPGALANKSHSMRLVFTFAAGFGTSLERKDFDADTWLLNVRNGAIDLRTGEFMESTPDIWCTKQANVFYDPDARSETLLKAVKDWYPKEEDQLLLQTFLGYLLNGETCEKLLPIFYGDSGDNGKSTVTDFMAELMGTYYATGTNSLLLGGASRFDLGRYEGVRYVHCAELPADAVWDLQRVKSMTGGDRMLGENKYSNPFELVPRFTVLVSGNDLPAVMDQSRSVWQRLRVWPWKRRLQANEIDLGLKDRLKFEETSGVLNWLIEGSIRWYQEGLVYTDTVLKQTQLYFDRENVIGPTLEEAGIEVTGKKEDFATLGAVMSAVQSIQRRTSPDQMWKPRTITRALLQLEGVENARRRIRTAQGTSKQVRGFRGLKFLEESENIEL